MLGGLPVVASFLDQLGVAAIIDGLCPIRDVALATHGQVIEAMIASRLTSPTPLVRVIDWAREWAAGHCFGIAPEVLNDDRPGRALDAIAPELDQIAGTVGIAAIQQFGLDVSRVHWDMTSISLYGACPEADQEYATPKFGHPKDRRRDLKQIQTGIGTSADGGIPIFHRACDGGAAEVSQVTGAMTALQEIAGERTFLLAGDSKLISYPNVRDMAGAKVTFTGPAPKQHVPAAVLAACDIQAAAEVACTALRDTRKPLDDRGTWRAYEDTMVLRPPRGTKGPDITVRRVFVHSTARAGDAKIARARKPGRARDDLDRLTRGLGSRHYPGEAAVRNRLAVIGKTRRVTGYLTTTIGTDPGTGKPALQWAWDQAALEAESATDGWYALLTNLDPAEAGTASVLLRFKGQEASERRYGNYKGPLAVAPMFLQHNRRIAALITVICLALLVFSLAGRQARAQIAPAAKIPGLYADRPARPTGWLIFAAMAGLRLIPAAADRPAVISRPRPLQQRLLDLLDVDPLRPP
ncbi:MAG TPA: IS1634 family transposase [Streptosporangiaceae bacterium]